MAAVLPSRRILLHVLLFACALISISFTFKASMGHRLRSRIMLLWCNRVHGCEASIAAKQCVFCLCLLSVNVSVGSYVFTFCIIFFVVTCLCRNIYKYITSCCHIFIIFYVVTCLCVNIYHYYVAQVVVTF